MGAIIGIISGLYLKQSIALFVILLIVIYLQNSKNKRYIKLFFNKKVIFAVGISTLIFFIYLNISEMAYENTYCISDNISLKGKIISKKTENDYYNKYIFLSNNRRFILLSPKNMNLEYGDFIKINAEYIVPDGARNYKGFNYRMYLKTQKIYGTLKTSNIEVLEKNTCNIISTLSYKLQTKIIENSNKILPEDTQGLFIGILLGEKTNISDDIIESFKTSSLSHILAVSGMHVSYIILGMTYIVTKIKMHRRIGYILTIIILIIFMLITNFSASVVRACIMGILLLFSKLCYRKSDIWTTIAISILIAILYNPYCIMNVGLQLSYAGTIGIILFNENVINFLNKYMNIKISQAVSVIISAQITILPIMICSFNTFSLTFIISNLLATPIVGIITMFGFVIISISLISVQISQFFAPIMHLLLKILILISDLSSKLPLSQIFIVAPSMIQIIYYYFVVVLINYILSIKDKTKRKIEKSILKIFYKKHLIIVLISIMFILQVMISFDMPIFTINFIDVGQRR